MTDFQTDAQGRYRIDWINPKKAPGERGHDWAPLPRIHYRGDRAATLRHCALNWPNCHYRVDSRPASVISV